MLKKYYIGIILAFVVVMKKQYLEKGSMDSNCNVLNRLFTQSEFLKLCLKNEKSVYINVVERYLLPPYGNSNKQIISKIYKILDDEYRNEYYYKNTLLNKLLIEKHDINSTTALTEVPISKSIADLVMINGKAIVYEIKTELDNFDRLNTQISDYFKAFTNIVVVTSERNYTNVTRTLKNINIGILLLTKGNDLIEARPSQSVSDFLDSITIFKLLRKHEFENIIIEYFGSLPNVTQVKYYDECLRLVKCIPIEIFYPMVLKELKKRNKITNTDIITIPYELRSLIYFSSFKKKEIAGIIQFLNDFYGGDINVFSVSARKTI